MDMYISEVYERFGDYIEKVAQRSDGPLDRTNFTFLSGKENAICFSCRGRCNRNYNIAPPGTEMLTHLLITRSFCERICIFGIKILKWWIQQRTSWEYKISHTPCVNVTYRISVHFMTK